MSDPKITGIVAKMLAVGDENLRIRQQKMSNEAAERLRVLLSDPGVIPDNHGYLQAKRDLDEALADEYGRGYGAAVQIEVPRECRATVERIEAAYRKSQGYPPSGPHNDSVLAILDAEAKR